MQENNENGIISSRNQPSSDLHCDQVEPEVGNAGNGSLEARAVEFDAIGLEKMGLPEDLTKKLNCRQSGPLSTDASIPFSLEETNALAESVNGGSSSPNESTPALNYEIGSRSENSELLEHEGVTATENVENGALETRMTLCDSRDLEQLGMPSQESNRSSSWGLPAAEELTTKSSLDRLDFPPKNVSVNSSIEQFQPPPEDVSTNPGFQQSVLEDEAKNTSRSGCVGKGTSVQSKKRKNLFRSLMGSTRILRSRSQNSKAPEMSNNLAEDGANAEKKSRKKRKRNKKLPVNEFSRIRTHLKYLLHRMKYEQNLIDAYSGEGWKGQSLEKIKPEKELQRAKSEIFRCKLKIRDLLQHLDTSCAEGRFPESLFDSEGQIDSEDIFCAKCGSKDLLVDDDIILCDGACERGFHQFCLEPPLLKEDIPPDDEGWLCPGCDCKVDCFDLLNDSQGTKLSISDSWEKVFPEVAATAFGSKLNDISGLPSDDSKDNDYDPDDSEADVKVPEVESSSDGTDYFSASDGLGASPNNERHMGLPSDDSEDDNYDPDAPDLDEQVKPESSSSDFTSDSEDFSVAFDESGKNQGPMSLSSDDISNCTDSYGEKSRKKRLSLHDELLSLKESDAGHGDSATSYGKRHVERLDYKQLYDEAYGNDSSDSSDEDFMDSATPKKRKGDSRKVAKMSSETGRPISTNENDNEDMKFNLKESESTPKKRMLDVEGINTSEAKLHGDSIESGSGGKSATRSFKRLGEAVTQRLFLSFKENQYPKRGMKENLAKELGLTVQQVSKWFENARWSFRHSSHVESSMFPSCIAGTSDAKDQNLSEFKHKAPDAIDQKLSEFKHEARRKKATCNGVEKKEPSAGEATRTDCNAVRKKKGKLNHEVSNLISRMEEPPGQTGEVNSLATQCVRRSGRLQMRSGKSVS